MRGSSGNDAADHAVTILADLAVTMGRNLYEMSPRRSYEHLSRLILAPFCMVTMYGPHSIERRGDYSLAR